MKWSLTLLLVSPLLASASSPSPSPHLSKRISSRRSPAGSANDAGAEINGRAASVDANDVGPELHRRATGQAPSGCVSFDTSWNLLAFGINGKDWNAGGSDGWASG